jgi:hypothetical protein
MDLAHHLLSMICNPCLQENTMNLNTVFIRAAIATAMVGVGLASFDVPHATATETSAMSIDARAPLQATLLPTVTVVGSASQPDTQATMTVASEDALSVTLMPTVRVRASINHLVAMQPAQGGAPHVESVMTTLPVFAPVEVARSVAPLVVRVRSMPR